MRWTTSKTAIVAALASTVHAGITLGDFQPYLTDLTGSCQTIYGTNVQRCSASDFSGSGCSSSCIAGLTALAPAVQGACANAGVTGNNVITAFLDGVGVTNLCPNAQGNPPISSQQQTTTSQPQTSSQAPSTSDPPSTTSTTSTTSTPSTTSTTSSQAATSSTTTSTNDSPSSTPSASTTSTSTSSLSSGSSSSASSSSAAFVFSSHVTSAMSSTSQTSSTSSSSAAYTPAVAGSGGGSPFDTPGNTGAAASLACSFGLVLSSLLGAIILMRV